MTPSESPDADGASTVAEARKRPPSKRAGSRTIGQIVKRRSGGQPPRSIKPRDGATLWGTPERRHRRLREMLCFPDLLVRLERGESSGALARWLVQVGAYGPGQVAAAKSAVWRLKWAPEDELTPIETIDPREGAARLAEATAGIRELTGFGPTDAKVDRPESRGQELQ